jgi:LacI family transcriptional regulator
MIAIVPGQGTRRLARAQVATPVAPRVVTLLSPVRLEQLRPQQGLWIDAYRGMLAEAGCRLRFVVLPPGSRASPAAAFPRLRRQESSGCWVLVRSSAAVQAWFQRQGFPCVVAGSCHEGIQLSSVDLDYRALCRHAALALLRAGHRRIALLSPREGAAGDLRGEEGFREGAGGFPEPVEASVVRHGPGPAELARVLRRMFHAARPPTGVLIGESYAYLTACSELAQLGRRVGADVSLVCRDEDRFLSYLEPEPARYVADPLHFARRLARITGDLLTGRTVPVGARPLLPRLVRGASLGPPPRG